MSDKNGNRDEFSAPVKKLLEQQAASRCCNPGCGQPTRARSWDGTKSINIGTAAHIHAAAEGGARFDPNMTPEKRKAADNGIWMCRNCGTLIDTDEAGFPAEEIRKWKREALEARRQSLLAPAERRHRIAPAQELPKASERDQERYQAIIDELPTTGAVIQSLKNFNAGFSFDTDWLRSLGNFVDKWTVPELAFSNPTIQTALREFTKATAAFLGYSALNTFVVDENQNRSHVPGDWEERNPKRYQEVVDALNAHADSVQEAHANLISTAKKELGL